MFYTVGLLSAVTDIAAQSASGKAIGVDELQKVMNSSASDEQKTSFFIQYLLSQREWLLDFAKTLLIAIVVFIIGRKIVSLALKITKKTMVSKDVEISVQKFVMSLATFAYNICLIIIIASILGIGASSIVAILGSAGLAVGLALQGSLSNLAGGVLILLLKPFKVGDYIISAGAEGTVQSIDIFYTRIATTDNKVVVIPNGTISNSNVTNTTKQDERMLVLDFTVGLNVDIEAVRKEIMQLFENDGRILHDMNMCVVVDKLTPVNIKMQAKAWTKSEDYWDVRYLLLEQISIVLQGFRG
ncbi:mechanosensitive ion channel [Eubacterium sp. MSJ-13]|uniref:mechanosensitive ion channel family protein n=1 Tax=Eubacterium sp. MSJ-13 TaxID=2841513 RepID=UPI001C118244|nr:mechanosensitive ion channel domain-containing protein [Eubacterium sp. MSJ-13]MBU5479517.1 mechanosensitive ion channel [Eubacterium sp. MSJ-13]